MIGAGCSPYIDGGVLLIEHDVCIVSKVATARRMGGAIVADVSRNAVTDSSTALWLGWDGGKMIQHIASIVALMLCQH